jgi:hypothetical protein
MDDDHVKGGAIVQIRGVPVHIQKDHCGQPGQPPVAIDEGVVARDRVEERGRLELEGRVGVFPEGARLRPSSRRIEETKVSNRPWPRP